MTKPVFLSANRSKMLKGSKSTRLILGYLSEAADSSLTMPGFLATIWLPKLQNDASGSQDEATHRIQKVIAYQYVFALYDTA